MVEDFREQAFGSGTVAGGRSRYFHRDEVFRPGQDENILGFVVTGNAFGGLAADAGYAQIPAESKRAVTGAGAVDEIDLGLKTVAPWRESDGNSEIAGAGMEVRLEFFAHAMLRATTFR